MSDISIVPTWGIRRKLGKHFTYKTGFGDAYYFTKNAGYFKNKGDRTGNLRLRFGYRF